MFNQISTQPKLYTSDMNPIENFVNLLKSILGKDVFSEVVKEQSINLGTKIKNAVGVGDHLKAELERRQAPQNNQKGL